MGKRFMKVVSMLLTAALLVPTIWLAPAAHAETADQVEIYHETFKDGLGKVVKSGNADLSQVTDKAFDGNDDGAALYVSDRSKGYDAADFKYVDMGLMDGTTYTVTISVYVDEGVIVPDGAEAYLQIPSGSYPLLANEAYEAGKAIILSSEFTVDMSTDSALRVQSNDAGASVPFYIGDILITTQETTAPVTDKEVYHETFDDGAGVAAKAGGVNLEAVTGVVFEGNDDGNAIYVDKRSEGWNGVDIPFSSVGMEEGKAYTITITGYIDEAEDIPEGAQALLQNVDSYSGLYVAANYIAGEAFTLVGEYTVDTSKDRALRIQSNDGGALVPFYIGDILITEKVVPEEEEPRDPALEFVTIDFEDQTSGGFDRRGDTEVLTVTDEANHTEGGSYALKVEGRTKEWHGPSLRVETFVDKGYEYKISAWVKLIDPNSSQFQLSTQIGDGDGASYIQLDNQTISTDDGWVLYEGKYRYNSVGGEYLTIYVESSNNATASFYIDDISFENTGSGPTDIQRDLTPIKDAYQDDFLIGNVVSTSDLNGKRLELMKLHHNVVTAENAMKPGYAYDDDREFDFTAEDELVDQVQAEGLLMHGHVLIWHQQSTNWLSTQVDEDDTPLTDESGKVLYLDRDEALQNMRTHIQTVVEHFGDHVISWDVVNEAMNDNPSNPTDWKAALRQSPWKSAIGDDYVEQAFLAAREVLDAHPEWDIKLYYNDYNEDNQNKATAIYNMVKELNDNYAALHDGKLLVDGIGMQGHYNLNTSPENVERSLETFISLGVEVSVTELDITAGDNHVLPENLADAQGYLYAQLFNVYKKHAANIARVTFWGLEDGSSWRADRNPLLFDREMQAKPAYYGVIDPDAFIAGHEPEGKDAKQTTAVYGTPVIDGTADAVWSQAPEIPINQYQMAWQGAGGIAKALWDEENLYVLFQVSDSQLDKSSANEYEQDSVEVFLDQNNAKTSFYQDDDGQYRVNFDNETSFNPAGIAEGFESASQVSGTNYTVEMKIPLFAITPDNGSKLGFDAQINDGKDGARISVATWNDLSGMGYTDPSVFGVLTLTGKGGSSNDGGNSGGSALPAGTVENNDGSVTIKPVVRIDNGRSKAEVSNDSLNKALEQAVTGTNGKKQVVIEIPKQANATSYEVQLPAASLKGQDNFILTMQTEEGTIQIPSNMLTNVTEGVEQVSIRIGKASTDGLDAAILEQIGDRPVIDLNLVSNDTIIVWNNPKAPVIVAIPYTPTAEELGNPDHIVVWYIDGSGQATAVPNGRYDAASGTVVFQTTHFSTYAVTSVFKSFGDLGNVPWAQQAIEVMASRDVIKGTSVDSYTPEASIKRADFIALLVGALELQGTGEMTAMFNDVAETAYYYDELMIAKQLGIAVGFSDNTFKPDSNISREDMMVLAVRALNAAGKQIAAGGNLDTYQDAANISDYAVDSAASLVGTGIVIGKNDGIAPHDSLTRAEAAVILYRIWNL